MAGPATSKIEFCSATGAKPPRNLELNANGDLGLDVLLDIGERLLGIPESLDTHRQAPVGGGSLPIIAGGGVQDEAI